MSLEDQVDAEVLAQLLQCDYLPEVWSSDQQTQVLRGLITHRTGVMSTVSVTVTMLLRMWD